MNATAGNHLSAGNTAGAIAPAALSGVAAPPVSTGGGPTPAHSVGDLARTIFHVAWMSIAIGLALEIVLLLLSLAFGAFKGGGPFLAGVVQKVTWSTLVCVGLAIGTAASKLRAPAMGIMGALSAPLAFTAAKSAHKSMVQALSLAGAAAGGPSALLLASIKGAQYAALGVCLGWLGRRYPIRLRAYLLAGLCAGLFFGGLILGLVIGMAEKQPPTFEIVARSINEIIFPVGCSLVLFTAEALGKRAAR